MPCPLHMPLNFWEFMSDRQASSTYMWKVLPHSSPVRHDSTIEILLSSPYGQLDSPTLLKGFMLLKIITVNLKLFSSYYQLKMF